MHPHPQPPLPSYPDHLRIHRTSTFPFIFIIFSLIIHNPIHLVESTQVFYNPGAHRTYNCSGLEDCYLNCFNSYCTHAYLYFTDHLNHHDLTINCTSEPFSGSSRSCVPSTVPSTHPRVHRAIYYLFIPTHACMGYTVPSRNFLNVHTQWIIVISSQSMLKCLVICIWLWTDIRFSCGPISMWHFMIHLPISLFIAMGLGHVIEARCFLV